MDKDVLNSLKGGFGLAGKLVSRGVDEVSRAIKKDETGVARATGLYFVPQDTSPDFGGRPSIRFVEPQDDGRFDFNFLRNLTMSGAEKAFIQGMHALLVGRPQDSVARLREATRAGGESKVQLTDAYFVLGYLLLSQGEPKEAERNFKTALLAQQGLSRSLSRYLPSFHAALPLTEHSCFCFYPDLLGLNLGLAMALRLGGQVEEAIHTMEQLLGIMPGDPVADFFVNLFRLEAGQHREVFGALQKTLPDSNIQVAGVVLLGRACIALGDPVTAREIFRKALQKEYIDPTLRLDLRHALGEALAAEGWANDAVDEFQAIKREKPGYQPLHKRMGLEPREAEEPAPARELPPQPPALSESAGQPAPPSAPPAPTTPEAPSAVPAAPPPLQTGPIEKLVCPEREIDHVLNEQTVVIGREEGDLVLEGDTAASRLHAQVVFDKGGYWVEDLGSTNGTWVNRHRISRRVELHRGDVLQIGETTFQIV